MGRLRRLIRKPTREELKEFLTLNGYSDLGNTFFGATLFGLEYDYELIGYLDGVPHSVLVNRSWGKWTVKKSRNVSHYAASELELLKNGELPPLVLKGQNKGDQRSFRLQLAKVR